MDEVGVVGHNALVGAVDEDATDKAHNEVVDDCVGDNSLAVETFLVRRDLGRTPHIPLKGVLVEALSSEGR